MNFRGTPVTLAYILNTYPQPSHSFIRREVMALEAAGQDISRIAMRRPTMRLVDPLDQAEAGKTDYVLDKGALHLIRAALTQISRQPAKTFGALGVALKMGARSPLGRMRHMIYWAEACAVARRCAAQKISHMHAHFGTNSATVAMLAHLAGGPTYSFTVHGPEEFDAPAALSLSEKITHAAFVVAISAFGRSQLCRLVPAEIWPRIKVVHCGIDPTKFPDPQPVSDGITQLVSIGRFAEQKGQLALIEAMSEVIKAQPNAHLTLIGDGEMRSQITAAIAQRGLEKHVTLTGWLAEKDVRTALDQAHALVMPSFAEGLPMVIMEAMAAGRPVIATYIAGIPELVQPGETGWLVPAGDVDSLTSAILDMAQTDPEKLSKMGLAGRARALKRHDITQEADKLMAHFSDAV
jgi:colanic acid/amylovoran biosynthesis glycosyltransferase